jgi:hypothetical protein
VIAKEHISPAPSFQGTIFLLCGLGVAPVIAEGETPVDLAHSYAITVGLSILGSIALDYRRQIRNLVRADLMAILSLYFLTLFEFLLPQSTFNSLVSLAEVHPALDACLCGFAGLAIGRHMAPDLNRELKYILRQEMANRVLLILYSTCFVIGFFHMLLAVDFDPVRMVEAFMGPRFSQPWSRGKFGDWKALLGELGMVIYVVPPIAGVVAARRERFTTGQNFAVMLSFLFVVFYGFTSGTRHVLATYLATFLVAFAFATESRRQKELMPVAAGIGAILLFSTVLMVDFRTIGFRAYLEGYHEIQTTKTKSDFYVDYNLAIISRLVNLFPSRYPYLGFEIPYLAIIRPIPRAIWKGKPEGMSVSMENAVGVEGGVTTVASSFVGEAYMSGGYFAVFLTGIAFGFITGWWNHLGRLDNSAFGHLIFASGFFAAVISMRSMFVFTTAMLPTIAALVLGGQLMGRRAVRRGLT